MFDFMRVRAKRTVASWRFVNRQLGPSRLTNYLEHTTEPRIVIGSGTTHLQGWCETEQEFLDLLKPVDWDEYFNPESITALLAEHVWEHLTPEEGLRAAAVCYTYLKPGGYIRIAVPDGFHPDPFYISWIKVGGQSPGQHGNGHKVLYNYLTLGRIFQSAGFETRFYEYYDEHGHFCYADWDPKDGYIGRSSRYDKRNQEKLVFASIVMDAIKPKAQGAGDAEGDVLQLRQRGRGAVLLPAVACVPS